MAEQRVTLKITSDTRDAERGIKRTAGGVEDLRRSTSRSRGTFDQFAREVAGIEPASSRAAGAMTTLVRALGPVAGIAGIGLFARAAKGAISASAAISENADVVGLSAESYQELTKAFGDLGGISEEVTTGALRRFNRRLGLAAEGAGAAKDTFGELGIAIRGVNANVRVTGDVLDDAIKELADIDSAAERAAKASQLFGEDAGPRLAAVLGQGQDAIDRTIEKLREQGRVMSDESVDAARRLNDRYNEIANTLQTTFRSAIVGTTDLIVESLGRWQEALGFGEELGQLASKLESLANQRDRILANLDTTPWPEQLREELNRVNQEMIDTERLMDKLRGAADEAGDKVGDLGGDLGDLGDKTEDAEKAARRYLAGLQRQIDVLGLTREQVILYDASIAAAAVRGTELSDVIHDTASALVQQMRAMEDATEGADKLGDNLDSLSERADPFAEEWKRAIRDINGAFVDLWESAFQGFESFADQLKTTFERLVAELAHAAITRPITFSLGASLGIPGSAQAAGGVPGVGGGLNLAGSFGNIGSFLGGNGLATGLNSAIGNVFGPSSQFAGHPALAGAAPNVFGGATLGYGIAGLAGSFIGGKIGGETGSVLGGLGSAAGYGLATGGTAIGSALGTLGWAAGPVGALVGAILGGAVGSLFGSDRKPRARLGTATDRTENDLPTHFFEDRFIGATSPFGNIGFTEGGTSAVDPTEFQDTFQGIAQLDQAIAQFLTPEDVADVREALDGWESELEGRTPDLIDQTKERLLVAADAIDPILGQIVSQFEGSVEEMASLIGGVAQLQRIAEGDPLQDYADAVDLASRTLTEVYQDQADEVMRLAGAYDGSLEATQELTAAAQSRYQIELQLLSQLDQAVNAVSGTLGGTIERITLDLLDQEGRYDRITTQAEELAVSLQDMTDPARIAATVQQIDRLTGQAYGLLGEDQRQDVGAGFIGFLGQVEDLALGKLDTARADLSTQSEELGRVLRDGLVTAGDRFNAAAARLESAAARFEAGASTPTIVRVQWQESEVNA